MRRKKPWDRPGLFLFLQFEFPVVSRRGAAVGGIDVGLDIMHIAPDHLQAGVAEELLQDVDVAAVA